MDNLSYSDIPDDTENQASDVMVSAPTAKPKPKTFREVRKRIEDDAELPARRKRELLSAIKRFLEIVGRADTLEASPVVVRTLARTAAPPHGRVSSKTWSNIRSNVLLALSHAGCGSRAPMRSDLSMAWNELMERIDSQKQKPLRIRLSRLAHWASTHDVEPRNINDDSLAQFHRHLAESAVVAKPDRSYQQTCKALNEAAKKIDGWPCQAITLPSFRQRVSLPREAFREDFLSELDSYIELLGSPRLNHRLSRRTSQSSRRGRSGPLRPSTVNARYEQLRRLSSALVQSGFDITQLQSLSQLVEVENFEQAMIWYEDQLGGPRPSLEELANGEVAMAQHHLKVPDEQLDALREIRDELRCRKTGMTDKNRERLNQFKDPMVVRDFFGMGDRLIALAGKAKSAKRAALLVQKALMHEMLLWAPMRVENLVNLNLDRHFIMNDGGKKGTMRIVIPAEEVKNDMRLEYGLPMHLARLLDLYLKRHRPALLNGTDDGWLFVSSERTHKHKLTVQQQITATAFKYAGIRINPHLYRHLAAYLYLKRHPNDVETIRRVLGHKRIETTLTFYAEFSSEFAHERYTEEVLHLRFGLGGSER